MKILGVRWMNSVIGVLKVDIEYDGVKYLIGVGKGLSEDDDIQYIADYGSTFPPEAGRALFNDFQPSQQI